MKRLSLLKQELRKHSSPTRAKISKRFFKTGKGEYGEGDYFIGVTVPEQRRIAKKYRDLPLADIAKLLKSKIHEERLTALILLVLAYKSGTTQIQKKIHKMYLDNARYINNWDLVDASAEYIVGDFLFEKNKKFLYRLARSQNLWERRIAMVSCFSYIKKGEANDAFAIAEMLFPDTHDLIHKAVGWMLREVGKRVSKKELKFFLDRNAKRMPRTTLRYALEHFSPHERRRYLRVKK
jgi:3-methyladenine DNA glycosylase AlkD